MQNRYLTMNLRVREEYRRKSQALADAGDEPIAQVIRKLLRDAYSARFGDAPPPRIRRRRKASTPATT